MEVEPMRLVLILVLGGALMPECLADPACDGGPESGAR